MDDVMEMRRIVVLPGDRLDRENAARFLGRSAKTLAEWQRLGKGPSSRLVGGRRFYNLGELKSFAGCGVA